MEKMKYTPDEIDKLARGNLTIHFIDTELKAGLIAECVFTYPNGNKHAWVEACFPMFEENHNREIAQNILRECAKNKMCEIAGQYTLVTGEKMRPLDSIIDHSDDK